MLALFIATATAATVPPPAPDSRTYRYVVRKNDTLTSLAGRYLSANGLVAVLRASRLAKPRKLVTGEALTVPYAAMRWTPVNGSVVSFRGRFSIGRVPGAVGAAIADGATVSTAGDSFVAMRFPDGTVATMPSNSTIRIVSLRQYVLTGEVDRRFVVEQGESEWLVTHKKSSGDRFEVRTPVSLAAVRGTEFRVTYDGAASKTGTGVVKGEVGFSGLASDTPTALPTGFGALTDQSGAIDKRVLLAAPALADGYVLQRARPISFTAGAIAGARRYVFEIARDAFFLDSVTSATSATATGTIPDLEDGAYFVRVSAIDDGGLQGLSKTYAFQRQFGELLTSRVAGKWRFAWTPGPKSTAGYRFQLSQREDLGEPLVDLPGLTGTGVEIGPLPPGAYFARITTIARDGSTMTQDAPFENGKE